MHEPADSLLMMFIIILGAPFLTSIVKMPVIVIEILIGIGLGYLGWIHEHPTLDFSHLLASPICYF